MTEITANEAGKATLGANDPATRVHTTATLPNSYPPQPLAGVHVAWGVIAKVNSPGTSTISDAIFCDTNLTNYVDDVPRVAQDVFKLFQQFSDDAIGRGADTEIHWSIRLDNPTAPPVAMGVVVNAKQHYDGHLSNGNVNSVNDIIQPIVNNIPFMAKIAKY